MPSAVRNRIASFEAASSKGGAPSPSRPISTKSNYHRPKNTAVPQNNPNVANQQRKEQQQEQQEEPTQTQQHKAHQYKRRSRSRSREIAGIYRDKMNTSTADTGLNTSIHNDNSNSKGSSGEDSGVEGSYVGSNVGSTSSTTVTASENRKSRIRQSQQLIRENTGPAPVTNLSEKRRQRRILQSKRRTKTTSKSSSDNAKKGAENDATARASGSRSSSRNESPTRTIDNSRVPDSPGDMSTGSYSSWAKLSRLQHRPKGIDQRESSAATSVTKVSVNSVETSLIQNTASNAAAKLGSRRGTKPVTPSTKLGSFDRMMSATIGLSPKNRKHKQQSPKNRSPSQRSAQSTKSSRSNSNYVDQQQLNASLEAPTDDDATLTSVHRIMEGKSSKHRSIPSDHNHNQSHSYESLLGQQQQQQQQNHSMSGRHNHNSYDSSVGPSWKLNRGAGNKNSIWKEDEKSDKMGYGTSNGRVLRTEYSSDYDMDDVRSRQSTQFAEGPSSSQATDANDYFANSRYHNTNNTNSSLLQNNNNRRIDDDDRTFDYGDRDDDSNEGASYARRRREAEQRRPRLTASSTTNNDLNNNNNRNSSSEQGIHQAGGPNVNNGEPMLLSKDDMEHLTMNDSPALRLSAGVATVATVGLLVGGPVGLLAGVAAGGLSFGFMQIPEEERKKIQAQAEKAMSSFQTKACDASEAMSSSCINTYQDSGVAEHVPQCLPSNITDQLVPNCPTGVSTVKSESIYNASGPIINSAHLNGTHAGGTNNPEHASAIAAGPLMEPKASSSIPHNERMRNKKVACLRNVRILPIAQIHGLEPSSQPRAWLDVVASANTSNEQKNEAMEEILLLAKDKRRAKIFLDEGILDYIIWTHSRYIEKVEVVSKTTEWAFPDIIPNEKTAAKLAAMCCVTLGKAHCAAIHTEGDLLLMSMYDRGTVPEERQVAQMLHEVPHHARVTKTNDPTIVQPSKEVFAPRQLNLAQAEELAKSFKLVAEGHM